MSSTKRNIVANLASKVWGFFSLYLFTNVYIQLVGIEAYGIISLYTVVLGIASFIDIGLSSAVNREFSKDIRDTQKLRLLFSLERIYVLMCMCFCLIILLLAPLIAKTWLNQSTLKFDELVLQLRLIGVGVSIQMISTIYFGALMGLQKQVWCNAVQVALNLFKAVGGVAVLYFVSNSLVHFFLWQIICNIFYLLILRLQVVKQFPVIPKKTIQLEGLPHGLKKYIIGTTGITVLSSISVQADKIISSKVFSLVDFSYYSLASLVAQVPVLIAMPVMLAFFPKMVKLFDVDDQNSPDNLLIDLAILIISFVVPICIIICFYNQTFFSVWLPNSSQNGHEFERLKYVTVFLTIGNAFLSFQLLPFHILLAKAKTKYTIYQGVVQVILLIPCIYYFAGNYGLNGIGVPWLFANVAGFFYLLLVVEKFISKSLIRRILVYILKATILSFSIVYILYSFSSFIKSSYFQLATAAISGLICFGFCYKILSKKSGLKLNLLVKT